jgi:hypothetical protein
MGTRGRWALLLGVALALGGAGAACGGDGDDASTSDEGGFNNGFGPKDGSVDAHPANEDGNGILAVTPAVANITITVTNGVVTANMPAQFKASYNGSVINATWLFDRGELGTIAGSTGLFTAAGTTVGDGVVTARYGAREGTAKVHITITQTENGLPSSVDAGVGGFGGLGGVGGEPLGGAVDPAIVARLKAESNASDMSFLYPYDKTVWPRGLLPPLLMWQTTKSADSVYVKLGQSNFTFEGTYSYSGQPAAGVERQRVRLEDAVWKAVTDGNAGDPLVVTVKVYSAADDKVYGPITESWSVADGVLKGTVYYNSYDSKVNAAGGAVIAIRPRSPEPTLAVAAEAGKCTVCHTLSADGSTLWAQDGDHYENGASYDLTDGGARTSYVTTGAGGIPGNNRKFVWSAPYPDGSFALASSRFTREAYTQTDAKLFARSNGTEVVSNVATFVQSAVTPAFAPDGKKVVFNFWEGPGGNGVTAGAGRTLAILDFSCGAAAGSVKCATTPTFGNMRQIYSGPTNYPAWPSFVPDGKAVVFHNTVQGGACGPIPPDRNSTADCQLTTWYNAEAELWIAPDTAAAPDAGAPPAPQRLNALNGRTSGGALYVPTSASHTDDSIVNYQPTVNPVASGGYYWVVFTSRRIYGNLITGAPWSSTPDAKKLWVAAIDIKTGAMDPSHPAFYLPGQELSAGNSRGFWVVDPCRGDGSSCESGDECCNGFCRAAGDGGALVCGPQPPGNKCSMEFEACKIDADCCNPKQTCINGRCAQKAPGVN